jgi:hypothetical protein
MKNWFCSLLLICLSLAFASTVVVGAPSEIIIEKAKLSVSKTLISISNPRAVYKEEIEPGNAGQHFFVMNDPFVELEMNDGVPESPALMRFDTENVPKPIAIQKFAFFGYKPTTIGFLFGKIGTNGSSNAQLILADTRTRERVIIPIQEGYMPLWQDKKTFPPSFATRRVDYIGGHSDSLGQAARIDQVMVYRDGKYRRDKKTETLLYKEKYGAISFTAQEKQTLSTTTLADLDSDLAEKVLDALYYGTKVRELKAVESLLRSLSPEVRDACQRFVDSLEVPSKNRSQAN